LIDDGVHKPTRENIIRALRRLVEQSKPGDSVYFHYSGHGGLLDPDYWNRFKAGKPDKDYDETLYPVDHVRAGQIRDFSLFNHFVKPMAAGVTVTCVMDCCHSGSVLDLPYSYRPTTDGTIRMRQSMDSLTNLAYLYILAGGMLPDLGFESVVDNLQSVTGEAIDNLQGLGVEELSSDMNGWMNGYDMDDSGGVDGTMVDTDTNDFDGGDVVYNGGDTDYGGDEIANRGDYDFTDEMDGGDGFFVSTDPGFSGGEDCGDADCGEDTDCDCCFALGEVLGAILED